MCSDCRLLLLLVMVVYVLLFVLVIVCSEVVFRCVWVICLLLVW